MFVSAVSTPAPSLRQWILFCEPDVAPSHSDPDIAAAIENAGTNSFFDAAASELLTLIVNEHLVILVGCGKDGLSFRERATATRTALLRTEVNLAKPIAIIPESDTEECIQPIVDGAILGLYTWDQYKSRDEDKPNWRNAEVQIQTTHTSFVERQAAIAESINQCRDIGNENADVAHAEYIESKVKEAVANDERCSLEIFGEDELREKGFHLHLAVNQASPKPPRLLIVSYQGADASLKPIALVGKGITYDTGGLNLKRAGMDEMRMDMCGAGTVFGTLLATLRLRPDVNVLFVFALAENAIGPDAYKPGDIVNSYAGITVEIGNTDAEGRLVMADANSYIADTRDPAAIINVATLTGAVLIALGLEYTGLMSTHDDLAEALLASANCTDDRAWRLPIYPELRDHIKSDFADCKNTGLPKLAGTISAGEFLRRFAQYRSTDQPWAHLDIAGTGMLDRDIAYLEAGATGAGVRLLTDYLTKQTT